MNHYALRVACALCLVAVSSKAMQEDDPLGFFKKELTENWNNPTLSDTIRTQFIGYATLPMEFSAATDNEAHFKKARTTSSLGLSTFDVCMLQAAHGICHILTEEPLPVLKQLGRAPLHEEDLYPPSYNKQQAPVYNNIPNCEQKVCQWPGCGREFTQRCNLLRHVNHVHLKNKQFVCPRATCRKAFSRRSHLNMHLKSSKHSKHTKTVCYSDETSDGEWLPSGK